MFPTLTQRLRVCSLIWLVTLCVMVGHAQIAQATCGDYLSGSSRQAIGHVADYSPISHQTLPLPATKIPVCTGSGCQPHQPTPHQPVLATIALEAILLPGLPQIPPIIALLRHDDQASLHRGPAGRVFRPPRTA